MDTEADINALEDNSWKIIVSELEHCTSQILPCRLVHVQQFSGSPGLSLAVWALVSHKCKNWILWDIRDGNNMVRPPSGLKSKALFWLVVVQKNGAPVQGMGGRLEAKNLACALL